MGGGGVHLGDGRDATTHPGSDTRTDRVGDADVSVKESCHEKSPYLTVQTRGPLGRMQTFFVFTA
jgi:hypothetical protein